MLAHDQFNFDTRDQLSVNDKVDQHLLLSSKTRMISRLSEISFAISLPHEINIVRKYDFPYDSKNTVNLEFVNNNDSLVVVGGKRKKK